MAASSTEPGTIKLLKRYARRLNVWLKEGDLSKLAEYCVYEWGGPPPDDADLHRDLFSAFLHYLGRSEKGKRIERSPSMRGKYLKRMREFFVEGKASGKPPKKFPPSAEGAKAIDIPYEEFACPECREVKVVGDLPAIDHYLRHFEKIEADGIVVRELGDYRCLALEDKLKIYQAARSFYKKMRGGCCAEG